MEARAIQRPFDDRLVSYVRKAALGYAQDLKQVPATLTTIIDKDIWRERVVEETGEFVRFQSFEEFATTPPVEGLGCDIRTLKNLCRDHTEALDAIERATGGKPGGDKRSEAYQTNTDNISNDTGRREQHGTGSDYALRRLRNDRPDLHESVLSGDLSPHAAMIEAGFRKRTIQLTEGDVEAAARKLSRHFDADELYRAMKGAK